MNDYYRKLIYDVRVALELRKIRCVNKSEEDVN